MQVHQDKLPLLKSALVKLIPQYSRADASVLADYILALTKQGGGTLKDLIDRYYRELSSFLNDEPSLPRFVDQILDNIRHLGIVEEQTFQEHLNSRRPVKERRSNRLAQASPYSRPGSQVERPKRGEPTNRISVTKIPQEVLDSQDPEGMVGQWFSRFGLIDRVLMYPLESKADIEYTTDISHNGAESARKAVSSPEAPFNNRFVKIWQVRDAVKEAQDDQVQEISMTARMSMEELQKRKETAAKAKQDLTTMMEDLAKKQDEERKRLLSNLDSVNEADKQAIMKSLGSVSAVIKDLPKIRSSIKNDTEEPVSRSTYPARGRGSTRGSASTRGRGTKSMALDNRLRTLLITPYTQELANPVYVKVNNVPGPSVLLKHLHQFGYVEDTQPTSNGIYVKYSKRWEAEMCMSDGKVIAIGDNNLNLTITWAESNQVIQEKAQFDKDVEMAM